MDWLQSRIRNCDDVSNAEIGRVVFFDSYIGVLNNMKWNRNRIRYMNMYEAATMVKETKWYVSFILGKPSSSTRTRRSKSVTFHRNKSSVIKVISPE